MKTSEQINEIIAALSKLQSENKGASLEGTNSHFKSKYIKFEDAWNAIKESLGKYSLSIVQELTSGDTSVCVTTLVAHSSGQWIEFGPLSIPFAKKDAHGIGSACSYAKRYALCAAIGIVAGEEDDDGNGAVQPPAVQPPKEEIAPFVGLSIEQQTEIEQWLDDDMELLSRIIQAYDLQYKKMNPPRSVKNLGDISETRFEHIVKQIKAKRGL
ncbi:Essential recombination function protein [uncultured Caudovirales phage]|uniref:Essential recombination function protein n=1 Tax=uncultured Caudovirales phage TaxID=2100421 RepID=A0A6J5LI30_9CAUD|nr:Essential recombination function protein [uncultured Caudovirales phage]